MQPELYGTDISLCIHIEDKQWRLKGHSSAKYSKFEAKDSYFDNSKTIHVLNKYVWLT